MKDCRAFRTLITGLTLGTAALGISSGAQAGHRHPEFPISISEAEARAEAHFAEVDSNGDGVLSRTEFDAADWPRPPREHGGSPEREATDQALFSGLDANGDGMLSAEEFSARKQRENREGFRRERIFDHLDADHDGQLSPEELPDLAARLRAMDADGDGMVTRDEALAHRQSQGRGKG